MEFQNTTTEYLYADYYRLLKSQDERLVKKEMLFDLYVPTRQIAVFLPSLLYQKNSLMRNRKKKKLIKGTLKEI